VLSTCSVSATAKRTFEIESCVAKSWKRTPPLSSSVVICCAVSGLIECDRNNTAVVQHRLAGTETLFWKELRRTETSIYQWQKKKTQSWVLKLFWKELRRTGTSINLPVTEEENTKLCTETLLKRIEKDRDINQSTSDRRRKQISRKVDRSADPKKMRCLPDILEGWLMAAGMCYRDTSSGHIGASTIRCPFVLSQRTMTDDQQPELGWELICEVAEHSATVSCPSIIACLLMLRKSWEREFHRVWVPEEEQVVNIHPRCSGLHGHRYSTSPASK
jgi:hypothetical protein